MSGLVHPFSPPFSARPLLVALLTALPLLAMAQTPLPVVPAPAPAVRPGEPITLNFVNADIEAVARTMATLTGRNVVVDPRVKGTMNLAAPDGNNTQLTLNTLNGALLLSGEGQWVGGRLRFKGEAQASEDHEAALSNLLNIVGKRSGRRSLIALG